MEIIAWIGLSQALLSGFLTLFKKKKSASDRLLSGWLFLLAIEFLTFGLESNIFPNFILLTNSFLLFNPALLLYITSLTNPRFKIKAIHLLHLLPYLIFKITAWIIEEPQKYETFFDQNNTLWFRIVFVVVALISWIVYLTLSGIKLTRHRRIVQNEFSTIDTFKKISWVLLILIVYILYSITIFIWGLLNMIFPDPLSITIFSYSVLLFFIYILGYYGLKQQPLFPAVDFPKPENLTKYKNSLLTTETKIQIGKKIEKHFKKERPYINPDLNMNLLSEQLNLPKHHITEVLNSHFGKNFFHFVNQYRIEAVKAKLAEPNNPYSIEAIGFECGFNSKSTFFSVFKKFTGLTPTQFKESNKG